MSKTFEVNCDGDVVILDEMADLEFVITRKEVLEMAAATGLVDEIINVTVDKTMSMIRDKING